MLYNAYAARSCTAHQSTEQCIKFNLQLLPAFLQQNLKLSEEQLKNLFLLRRAFLHRQALILGYQHDLQLGLQSGQQKQDAQLQALQYTHQMQDFAIQLHEAFMQFMGGLYTGVSSSSNILWIA